MQSIRLPYGLRNGKLCHITTVVSGLACDCICPKCSCPLVAKKGNDVAHHFAHHNTEPCVGAVETALQLAANDVFDHSRQISLPPVRLSFDSNRNDIILAPSQSFLIDSIAVEERTGDTTPDLIASIRGHELLISIFVTRRGRNAKLDVIKAMNISAIEIDLSSTPTDLSPAAFGKLLVDNHDNKRWVYNAHADRKLQEIKSESDRKLTPGNYIKDCPIKPKSRSGWSLADVGKDCRHCKYCIEFSAGESILCNGRQQTVDQIIRSNSQ